MKPDAICVGFPKSGTTTLYNILKQHPEIYVSEIKEPLFYNVPKLQQKGFSWYQRRYYAKATNGCRIVEINPMITKKNIAKDIIADFGPNIKIILLLRNPIERLFSDFRMNLLFGCCFSDIDRHLNNNMSDLFDEWVKENFQFDDAGNVLLFRNHCDFIDYGEYEEKIEHFRSFFPSENIKYVLFEEFIKFPQKTCEDLFGFLDVNKYPTNICYNLKSNEGNRIPRNRVMIGITNGFNRYVWRDFVIPYVPYISDYFSHIINNVAWSIPKICSRQSQDNISKTSYNARVILRKYYLSDYNYLKNELGLPVEQLWDEFKML